MTPRKLLVVVPIVFSVAAADVAMAQTPPAAMDKGAPVAGANSFTEAQAKERIEAAGFTQVSGLRKDDQGIWRASAKKGEAQVNVSLDFRGNIVTQ